MDPTQKILIGVAKADLIVCTVLRWLGIIVTLGLILLLIVILIWPFRPDPYLIDYDAPGVDITSEGQDCNLYDEEEYEVEEDQHTDHQFW